VTVADLNGDTYPDLIVPHNGTNTTLILYGKADGVYDSTGTLADGAFNSQHAAVADFNADGLPDIAIVHYFDGVFVWLQNPDGSFGAGGHANRSLSVSGNFNRCLAAGDVNGDSNPDLVIVSETGSLTVWLSPGAGGSWIYGGSYNTAASVSDWVVLADLNEDGHLDAAVSNDDPSNSVSILLGNPGGHFPYFGGASTIPVAQGANTCTVADLNGDSHMDVLVSSWYFAPVGGAVTALLGNGNGSFQPALITHYFSLRQDDSFAIAAGELTGDGLTDAVVTNGVQGTVAVLPGLGNGAFGTARIYGCGSGARGVALADVDRDGRSDIIVSNLFSNTVQILTADSGHAYAGAEFATGSEDPSTFNFDDRFLGSLASGDLNGDGHLDLATNHPTPGTVSVILGGGDGTFGAPTDIPVGPNPQALVIADLDRDGFQDVAVASKDNGTVALLPGKGDGTFKAKINYGVGKDPVDLIAADVNSDGRLDLITANSTDNTVSVLLKNNGAGFKDRINSDTAADPRGVAAGDVNRDGRVDLAVADSAAHGFSVLLGSGNGKYPSSTFYFTGGGPTSVALADLNRDGWPDVALSDKLRNRVELWMNSGGSFTFHGYFFTFAEPRKVIAGDLDGDGWLELFVAARSGQTFVLYPFSPNAPRALGRWAFGACGTAVLMADANEDGTNDLITLHPRSQSVSVLLNETDGGAALAAGRLRDASEGGVQNVSLSPNPLNPAAVLKFAVTKPGPLHVRLYDVQGRLVRTLLNESHAGPGERLVRVDGADDRGARLGSGVYYFRIESAGESRNGRFVMLK